MPGVAEPAGAADLSHGADSATGGDDDEGPLPMEETAFLDADGGAATTDNRKRGKKAGVPNWAPMEAVACVWAQIAQCEEEQQQPFTKLQSGAMARYLGKAKDLHGKGKWNARLTGGRTPAQSALIRAGPGCEPISFWAKAEKLKSAVINQIVPVWWQVQDEQHSGWDQSEKVKETLKRSAPAPLPLLPLMGVPCMEKLWDLEPIHMFVFQVLGKSLTFSSLSSRYRST